MPMQNWLNNKPNSNSRGLNEKTRLEHISPRRYNFNCNAVAHFLKGRQACMDIIQKLLHRVSLGIPSPPRSRPPHRPLLNTPGQWRAYWEAQGQLWRTEPEIHPKRQAEFARRRAIVPDVAKGIYPFKGVKLSRADIEWLLATKDEVQRESGRLDLRGADLSKANLMDLPLTRMLAGRDDRYSEGADLEFPELRKEEMEEQRSLAAMHGKEANFSRAHLEDAILNEAHLEQAHLNQAHLEGADLTGALRTHIHLDSANLNEAHRDNAQLWEAHLDGSDLAGAHLGGANLHKARLKRAILVEAHLEGADLVDAHLEESQISGAYLTEAKLNRARLEGANLAAAHLEQANLTEAHLEKVDFTWAHLQEADLTLTYLQKANFHAAHLEGADLTKAHLEDANLGEAHLEGANLRRAHLDGANLRRAHLEGIDLKEAILADENQIGPCLADVSWGNTNLPVVRWSQVKMLGDEYEARQKRDTTDEKLKDKSARLQECEDAVRANRQLATALQTQGLNEDAARFAYRAQVLQKTVFRLQMVQSGIRLRHRVQALSSWLFSWFLFLLAGYGYKPGRSLLAYLLVIVGFTALYLRLDGHLAWYEAGVVSMTAFHGRGFSPSTFSPGDPLSIASAFEAFVGLIIEVTFIATLTQRFFNK